MPRFATSKITSKGQITVPKVIRERLGVKPGDTLIYEVADDTVTLKRLDPFDAAYRIALAETLDEWASPEDDEAFADLGLPRDSGHGVYAAADCCSVIVVS